MKAEIAAKKGKADDCRAALESALVMLRQAVKLCPAQSFTKAYTRDAIADVNSALSDISNWPGPRPAKG